MVIVFCAASSSACFFFWLLSTKPGGSACRYLHSLSVDHQEDASARSRLNPYPFRTSVWADPAHGVRNDRSVNGDYIPEPAILPGLDCIDKVLANDAVIPAALS